MEEIVSFGNGTDFGILTPARAPTPTPTRVAVVLLNAGLIHRPGPLRLHVDLARQLAGDGFDVFRFDLPGIGDAGREGGDADRVGQAFDALSARTGAEAFVVGGICSAADLGWRMVQADARVRGLFMIDPMAVRNGWYRLGRGQLLLRNAGALPGKLRHRWQRALGREALPPADVEDYRDWPTPDVFRAVLGEAMARGVDVLALYTGGITGYLTHPRQLAATFGDLCGHRRLWLQFRPELDHILFAATDRRQVVTLLRDWAVDAFHHGQRKPGVA